YLVDGSSLSMPDTPELQKPPVGVGGQLEGRRRVAWAAQLDDLLHAPLAVRTLANDHRSMVLLQRPISRSAFPAAPELKRRSVSSTRSNLGSRSVANWARS